MSDTTPTSAPVPAPPTPAKKPGFWSSIGASVSKALGEALFNGSR
jgi:hypothetical protein